MSDKSSGEKAGWLKAALEYLNLFARVEKWYVKWDPPQKHAKRIAWAAITALVLLVWSGSGVFWRTVALLTSVWAKDGPGMEFGSAWDRSFPKAFLILLGVKFLISVVLGLIHSTAIQHIIEGRLRDGAAVNGVGVEQVKQILEGDAGIDRVYPQLRAVGFPTKAVQQDYANDMKLAARTSKSVKILGVACFEYFGAKEESLLYEVLRESKVLEKVHVLVVDPKRGKEALDQRAIAIGNGHQKGFSAEVLADQIRRTLKRCDELREARSGGAILLTIESKKLNFLPQFRLVLTDDVLFVSAYSGEVHGHESVMLRVQKMLPSGRLCPLFTAFVQYFELLWSRHGK